MRILVAAVALASLAGCRCGGDPPRTGSGATATDALWALAPAGARGGLVASPRAMAMTERAVADMRGMLERVPELAPWRHELDELLRTELKIAGASLAELGLTAQKGLALFLVRDGIVAILPVADRARFLARAAGTPGGPGGVDRIRDVTCREVRGAHYACATSAALLDTLGEGDLGARLGTVGARGDVEVVGVELALGGPEPGQLAAVVQLARGAAVIRGTIRGAAPALVDRAGGAHRPRVDAARTAGFAIADVAALAGGAGAGGALDGVLRSLRGPLSITVPAGGPVLEAEQALADPAPVGALLERCPELLGPLGISATLTHEPPVTCRMTLPASSVQLDAWLDGDRLRLGRRDATPPTATAPAATPPSASRPIPLTPIGAELARGAWGVAFWGRGTMLRAAALPAAPPAPLAGDAILSIRALALISELGGAARREPDGALAFVLAVRTAFANPDHIVTKLTAISADEIVSGRAAAAARPIAEAAPGAPFASDFAAGEAGLLIPTAVMNAAVRYGVPALLRERRP